MEIGPYRLKDDATLEYNSGSWDEFANLLFVDNPVGTGFSYVDTDSYLHDLPEMADQFVIFLDKFFQLFPEYEQDDVSSALESQLYGPETDTPSDIYSRRVIRRATYPIHRKGNT